MNFKILKIILMGYPNPKQTHKDLNRNLDPENPNRIRKSTEHPPLRYTVNLYIPNLYNKV